MINAFSVDLEDWFCTYNLTSIFTFKDWDTCELRVAANTERIFKLLEANKTKATFFVLGWIAERVPELIREIASRGHELAVHGYGHKLLTQMNPEEFEKDLQRTLRIIRECGVSEKMIGFRAPSFTVVKGTMWALPVLERNGLLYDSSVFPVGFHPDYGIPSAPLVPYMITEKLHEFPLTCVDVMGKRLPCSGGAYFRIFPYLYTQQCYKRCNALGRPVVFYLHPWEIDAGQPRMKMTASKRFRQYTGLRRTEEKLHRLLNDFQFTTMREVLGL